MIGIENPLIVKVSYMAWTVRMVIIDKESGVRKVDYSEIRRCLIK